MKSIIKNTITKKVLIVFITIIMLSNFIVPNVVLAKSEGEKLVSGLFYLIAYVGDVGLSIMQRMMMGTGDLKENGEYAIRYSPGLIFAGEVPMLDIDFINADENSNKIISRSISDVNSKEDMLKLTSNLTNDNFTLLKEITVMDLLKDEHQEDFLSYGLQVIPSRRSRRSRINCKIRGRIPFDRKKLWKFLGNERHKSNIIRRLFIKIRKCIAILV